MDAADAISEDAAALGAAAASIIEELPYEPEHGLPIDRIYLEASYRGNRITGAIIHRLCDMFRLGPLDTLTLLYPESQQPDGCPIRRSP